MNPGGKKSGGDRPRAAASLTENAVSRGNLEIVSKGP